MRYEPSEWLTMLRIARKWKRDSLLLPLVSEHREVYDNLHRRCWKKFREFPDLVDCRDYNDKIQWLKLFDQRKEIVQCSDKVLVRDYVRARVGNRYLVAQYQVCDHYAEIDFDRLPDAFVIKTNHDSGTVVLVRDKSMLDHEATEARIEKSLARPYGWKSGEWAYSYIEPKVFVEEYIDPKNSRPPADYKFHCVDGRARWLQYICDRGHEVKECIVELNGQVSKIHLDHKMEHSENFEMPENWAEMKAVAEQLADGFKYVRVDLYNSTAGIHVGELTFYPLSGFYKSEGQKELGRRLDFDRATVLPSVLRELEAARSRFSIYPNHQWIKVAK